MLLTLIGTMTFGLAGLAIYIYYFQKGQFDDVEDIKYQLFRNSEDNEEEQ